MKTYIFRTGQYITKTPKSRLLPILYLSLVVFGLALGFASIYFTVLNMCSSPFGSPVCAPIGMYIVVAASFPGYLVTAFLEAFTNTTQIPEIASMLLVALLSLAFYYGIGIFVDRKLYKRLSPINTPLVIVLSAFVILVFVFLYLLKLSSK